MHILILIGPPGCGKGTLSTQLQSRGYHAVSTGDLLRNAAKTDAALAAQLATGSLTNDRTITALLARALEGQLKVLLDGYPRTLSQVKLLRDAFPDAQIQALELRVPDEVALTRVAKRRQAALDAGRIPRPEDDPVTAARRLEVFYDQTAPVVLAYRRAGALLSVPGHGSPAQVGQLAARALLGAEDRRSWRMFRPSEAPYSRRRRKKMAALFGRVEHERARPHQAEQLRKIILGVCADQKRRPVG